MAVARHNYEYHVDPASDTAPAHVVRLVGDRKRVLELGCGPGSITRVLAERGCRVTGMERDPAAIDKVRPYCDTVLPADLNRSDWADPLGDAEPFDVVVAADVLEHLYEPWHTLRRMGELVSGDGYVVVSLPHVGHAAITACLIHGDFAYRDWGLLDRTHIRFFCLKNMQQLFDDAGLTIVDVHYVAKAPQDTEFASIWAALPRSVRSTLRSSPHSDVYQVVVKAVPAGAKGDAVGLVLRRTDPKPVGRVPWRSRLAAVLGPRHRRRLRHLMSLFGIRAEPNIAVDADRDPVH